jgi:hypothetical protein
MPPSAVAEVTHEISESTRKFAWQAALKWGFGTVVLCVVSWVVWATLAEKIRADGEQLKESQAFIREQLVESSRQQATVIAQNGEQLKQNSDVMRANQQCLEACTESHKEVVKVLERLAK